MTTPSENVTRQVSAFAFVRKSVGECRTIETSVGALSITYVLSFAPVGVVFANALPARSETVGDAAKDSVTVPFIPARSPPEAFTSHSLAELPFAAAVSVAVVPPIAKSASPTPVTSSENVTRQVTSSAAVGDEDGVCRTIEATRGAVLSTTYASSFAPVGVVFANAIPARFSMSWPAENDSVTVAFRPARSPPEAVTSYST